MDKKIEIADTSTWNPCSDEQLEKCENDVCGVSDGEDDLTSEQEACFNECLFDEKCIDPLG